MTDITHGLGQDPWRGGSPAMHAQAEFWDRIADKYAASPIKNMAAYEQTMERVRAYLSTDQHILEVGCGTGSTALLLAPAVRHVTATDISQRMVEIGQAKARDQGVDAVTFRRAALPDAALAPNAFDAILCFNTLHLVTDLPATLRNLHGALKPGGVFISKTVCLAEQTRLWAIPIAILRLVGKAPYVNMLTFDAVEQAIASEGFKIVETGVYPAPFSRFVVARKA